VNPFTREEEVAFLSAVEERCLAIIRSSCSFCVQDAGWVKLSSCSLVISISAVDLFRFDEISQMGG
jgi:hypothetical protein